MSAMFRFDIPCVLTVAVCADTEDEARGNLHREFARINGQGWVYMQNSISIEGIDTGKWARPEDKRSEQEST